MKYSKIRRRPLFSSPPPARKSRRWSVGAFLWRAVKRLCFLIGFFSLIGLLLGTLSLFEGREQKPARLPDQMVLYMDLTDGLADQPAAPGLSDPFAPPAPSLQSLIDALDRAAQDARVKGLVATMRGGDFELAHIEEMRAALHRFRDSGKFTYIYADTFGDAYGGLGRFYLASAFEQRWMQPLGTVSIPGARIEMPFFRSALDKIGITPQFYHRKEYKTLFESATAQSMSPQNREMLNAVLADIKAHLLPAMAKDLNIAPQTLSGLIDKGLFTAREAKAAGLITNIDYDDNLYNAINEIVTGNPDTEKPLYIDIADYATRKPHGIGIKTKKIALIYAEGAILETAEEGAGALGGDTIIAADEFAPTLFDIGDDESINAVILRIDSPGGSPVASESILRGIEYIKQKGKPVIVSMGATAASGGYWIASGADRIFALPTTLTGSIGVAGGKVSLGRMWNKWGVNWDYVSWGKNAGLWSINTAFSDSEAERINATMDQVYDSFIARVAHGRNLKPEEAERAARGRVWSGASAAKAGLVDELGGLTEALDYTARLLGQRDRRDLHIVVTPKPKSAFEELKELLDARASVKIWPLSMGHDISAPLLEMIAVLSSGPTFVYEPVKLK